jgi:hypothetical protein
VAGHSQPTWKATRCLLARNWQKHLPTDLFVAELLTAVRLVLLLPTLCHVQLGGAGLAADLNSSSTNDGRDGSESSGLRLRLEECRSFSPSSPFDVLVRDTACAVGVEPRALAVRGLLHIPRVASYKGWVTRWQVERELRLTAKRLRNDARAASRFLPVRRFLLTDLLFEEIDSARALPVLTSLHYLRSARPHSRYFALVDPIDRRPVSLCSVSSLEWKPVARRISAQFAIPQGRVWDISRVYSVDGSPPNAISLLLSRVRTYVRRNMSSADLLVTAVDPNLSFTGCSYRAANWQQWMTVQARPYLYENRLHVTPRQLRQRFGTSSLDELQARYPGRFQQSKARLLDSMIYCCSLNGETKAVLAQDRVRLHR